jgi:LruC domain-containing protein
VDFEENWDYRMMIVPWEEPPFNTFIFVHGDRTHEIHPADYPPTELVNDELWGDDDDTSDPDEWRYYRTPNNLPWVFMVPIELPYPTERSPWEYNDWYMDEPGYRNYNYIYTPPGE